MNDFVKALLVNIVLIVLMLLILDIPYHDFWHYMNFGIPILCLAGINILISLIRDISGKADFKIFLLYSSVLFLIGFSVCTLTLTV